MQPITEKLPEWIQAGAGLILLAIIMAGGYWLQQKEKKDRAIEKEQMRAAKSENNEA
jgi:hypothetical protein